MHVDRTALKALGALLAALLLALAGAEAVLGAFYPQERMSSAYVDRWGNRLYRGNAAIRHRRFLFDVTYHTNDLGFRGPSRPLAKPSGTARVVVLGASFVFGSGVPDGRTYSELLEARLNAANLGKRFEVINLGAPGTVIAFHELLYRDLGRRYAPDVVVVHIQLNERGDLTPRQFTRQDAPMDSGVTSRASLVRALVRGIPGYDFLCENSHLWALKRKSLVGKAPAPTTTLAAASAAKAATPEGEFEAMQRGYVERLDAIVTPACADGSTVVVLRSKDHLARFPEIDRAVRGWEASRKCVKPLELEITPAETIHPSDPHWNERGHAAAAEALERLLRAQVRP